MSEIQPFRGVRPRPDKVAEIAAPPYDVVDRQEALAIIAKKPESFLRVSRPDVAFPVEDVNPHDRQIFVAGRRRFDEMLRLGLLHRDAPASLYCYELTLNGHSQTGIVAGCSLDEYDLGLVKRHEKTRKPELEGRTLHTAILAANAGPTFLTYRARPEIDAWVSQRKVREPVNDFVAEGGVRHRLWTITEPEAIKELRQAFAQVPAMYIADGHHRTAASGRVREQHHAMCDGEQHGSFDYFLGVIFPHNQLRIMAYNRVVRELAGLSAEAFKARVAQKFVVEPCTKPEPDHPREFGMYVDKRWYRVSARPEITKGNDLQNSFDVSILQNHLLAPILRIEQPRTDPRLEFVGGLRGTGELERRADGSGGVAFAMYPVSIEEVMAIADAGEVMPPKSTWFEPKLASGLVVRLLDPCFGSGNRS